MDRSVRISWLVRLKTESIDLTPIQLDKMLKDRTETVREWMAKNHEFKPMPGQVERGLTDDFPQVRKSWARRTDFTSTPEQIERGSWIWMIH